MRRTPASAICRPAQQQRVRSNTQPLRSEVRRVGPGRRGGVRPERRNDTRRNRRNDRHDKRNRRWRQGWSGGKMLQCQLISCLIFSAMDRLFLVHLRARHAFHHRRCRCCRSQLRTYVRSHGDSGCQNRHDEYADNQPTK